MNRFTVWDTAVIVAMVAVYIVVTTWISLRLRSKTNEQFMVAGRSMLYPPDGDVAAAVDTVVGMM